MPKETFFNLPAEKRRLIEETAVAEFATWGFDNASINRIVAEAQIAKGSFYQYFEDKKDLFKHVIARITADKRAYMSPLLQDPGAHEFFTLLTEMYRSGLAFAKENPMAGLVGNQVFKNREHPVYQEILSAGRGTLADLFETLLKPAIARGEIRPDINPRFVGHVLHSLSIFIFEYYFEEVKRNEFDMAEIEDDVMETVRMTLDFVKHGITLGTKEPAR